MYDRRGVKVEEGGVDVKSGGLTVEDGAVISASAVTIDTLALIAKSKHHEEITATAAIKALHIYPTLSEGPWCYTCSCESRGNLLEH